MDYEEKYKKALAEIVQLKTQLAFSRARVSDLESTLDEEEEEEIDVDTFMEEIEKLMEYRAMM